MTDVSSTLWYSASTSGVVPLQKQEESSGAVTILAFPTSNLVTKERGHQEENGGHPTPLLLSLVVGCRRCEDVSGCHPIRRDDEGIVRGMARQGGLHRHAATGRDTEEIILLNFKSFNYFSSSDLQILSFQVHIEILAIRLSCRRSKKSDFKMHHKSQAINPFSISN